jgi:hypothetical protein
MPDNYSDVVWPIGNIMPTLTTLGECIGAYGDSAGMRNLNDKNEATCIRKRKPLRLTRFETPSGNWF